MEKIFNKKKFLKKNNLVCGFTLLELLVVIAIIGVLASIVMASLNSSRNKAQDATRLSDMNQMQLALDLYYNTYGSYPSAYDAGCAGWDDNGDGTFITPLVSNNFLPKHLTDPMMPNGCGNYAYYKYSAGGYGCDPSRGAYYVLGVRDMKSTSGNHSSSRGWSCPSRNWQNEFEWVVGKFEN